MAEFDDKLNSILGNPEIMSQIMSIAGSMNQQNQNPPPSPPPPRPQSNGFGGLPFDPAAMAGMMELLKGTQLDQKQQGLIRALHGYLPDDRLIKLQKAMQAAKIAKYASSALGRSSNSGR